jgi:hypothetical protein
VLAFEMENINRKANIVEELLNSRVMVIVDMFRQNAV